MALRPAAQRHSLSCTRRRTSAPHGQDIPPGPGVGVSTAEGAETRGYMSPGRDTSPVGRKMTWI